MLEFLNANEGLISTIGVIVSIIIAIIGLCINKNIEKISQNQLLGDKSRGNQAGKDITDQSQNIGDGSSNNNQFHGK